MSYLILIISLVGIVFGAEFLVAGSVSVARRYKVSDFVIGTYTNNRGTNHEIRNLVAASHRDRTCYQKLSTKNDAD